MTRCFFGNFDFEHELCDPLGWRAPARIRRRLAEQASLWIALAEDGDVIWTPAAIDESFWDELASRDLPRVRGVSTLPHTADESLAVIPWGWSRSAVAIGGRTPRPSDDSVRMGNSRAFSFALEHELQVALPGAIPLQRVEELPGAVLRAAEQFRQLPAELAWVVKANLGMAARERILGRGPAVSPTHVRWFKKRVPDGGAAFFEPWLTIQQQVGVQLTVPRSGFGSPQLEGITPLLTDPPGGYRGSLFGDDNNIASQWQTAITACVCAAERLQSLGYFGPVGIDAAVVQVPTRGLFLRPLQDINARYTMGRLALGMRRLLRPGGTGAWLHLSRRKTAPRLQAVDAELIETTPEMVGDRPTQLRSVVVLPRGAMDLEKFVRTLADAG